jgi:eukaryotic-like serine/threonine-protein kinase
MRVSATGGTPAAITRIDTTQHTSHRWPFFLPDGKHFLYAAIHHDASKAANNAIYYASLDGSQDRLLFRSQSNAIYAAGFVLFARGDQLVAQAFDPAGGKLFGEPQMVAKGVMNDSTTWHVDAFAANDGLLVFGSGESADIELVWLDRASKQASTIAGKFTNLQLGQISPQGDRIALQVARGANDIWVLDLARGVNTRLTFGPVANIFPVWSPDEKWIAYSSIRDNRFGIYRKPSDGSGGEELLFQGGTNQLEPDSWSRDGEYLIYTERAEGGLATSYVFVNPAIGFGRGRLWALLLSGDRKPQSLVQQGGQARLSPSGHWLAYNSNESGAVEVYVVPFGSGQGKWQISSTQGALPHWSSNGKELFYSDPSYNLFAVPVKELGGTLQFGAAAQVASHWSAPQFFYDVAPDGKKILLDRVAQQVSQSVSVITNWTADLKK